MPRGDVTSLARRPGTTQPVATFTIDQRLWLCTMSTWSALRRRARAWPTKSQSGPGSAIAGGRPVARRESCPGPRGMTTPRRDLGRRGFRRIAGRNRTGQPLLGRRAARRGRASLLITPSASTNSRAHPRLPSSRVPPCRSASHRPTKYEAGLGPSDHRIGKRLRGCPRQQVLVREPFERGQQR